MLRMLSFVCLSLLIACTDTNPSLVQEDYKTGTIRICVDESYQPILEEILKVHASSYPNVHTTVEYLPESECVKRLTNDSFRLIILARKLSDTEYQVTESKIGFQPRMGTLAYDALAVIVHRKAKDSLLTLEQLSSILQNPTPAYIPVVDALKESSILSYLSHHLLKGKPYASVLKGTQNSKALVEYVAQHPKAIGFVGVSWVGNREDSFQLSFSQKIKILALPCTSCEQKGMFVKPYQANIALQKYPFLRELTYVLKENYDGPARGLVNFMSQERGQLLFKRAYLVPAKMNFNVRQVKLSSF